MESTSKTEDIVEYVRVMAGALCQYPEQLTIESSLDERGVLLMLNAEKGDIGRLIGKKGETVNAMRSILRAIGSRANARYSLKVDDPTK